MRPSSVTPLQLNVLHVYRPEGELMTKYLVMTDHGDVVVSVNEACDNALQKDLFELHEPTPENTKDLEVEVPLRAFGAKVIEIIEKVGTGEASPSPKLRDMMIKEKATEDLARIERWARDRQKETE